MKNIWIPFTVSTVSIVLLFMGAENLEIVFTDTLNHIVQNKSLYSLFSFLILASDIILPVPSSVVMFLNGFVLGKFLGSLLSLISLLIGAAVGYCLGMFTSYGFRTKRDNKASFLLEKYGSLAILLTRGIPIISESVCIVYGYNKMPFKHYMMYNLLGYIPVCVLYAVCGSFGYDKNVFLISFLCSLFISFAFWILGKKYLTTHLINEE